MAMGRQPLQTEVGEARSLLVALLRQAAQLEHCLLAAYLFAACSLRSTPQEFGTMSGKPNRRRAIQFERARKWKLAILNVAHEEMLHLHYVECMLRALGEPPSFDFPARDPESGNWRIPNWRAEVGAEPVDGGEGVEVPIAPLTPTTSRRFVLFESSNSLQDADPFGPEISALFRRLQEFELDLHFEGMLRHLDNPEDRERLKDQLTTLYSTLLPLAPEDVLPPPARALARLPEGLPAAEEVRFQSIADLYNQGILPLYEEAFEFGWVTHAHLNLNDELLNESYAAEGLLPIGPVYRDKNFEKVSAGNIRDPLVHYRNVRSVVGEIVEEGEGVTRFHARAEALLAKVNELGGAEKYLQALLEEKTSPDPTPSWLAEGQLLRHAHLYEFAMVLDELTQERELAAGSMAEFDPVRQSLDIAGNVGLGQLTEELPAEFNACYLVLVAWLSRMYEIREWQSDIPRRLAIEMLASWPLMSLAIRPFLELTSCFPVNLSRLFRLDAAALPMLPLHAQQLRQLYQSPERSEAVNAQMDRLAVRVLSDVASWAQSQQDVVASSEVPADLRPIILARLAQLAELNEFERQFPYRISGGYSSRMPDITYQKAHPDADRFEEDPSKLEALFEDSLVVRLRFSGWGLVQLATDPDPPRDEVGCTGTHMLHAADGDVRLDRALIWQLDDPAKTILREPRGALPELGVNVVDVSLLVTEGKATAGYMPLQELQSTGAVQTSGIQQVLGVEGLNPVLRLTSTEVMDADHQLRLALLAKDGQPPFLNGSNHLVWQDGEPIDPFILAVLAGPRSDGTSVSSGLVMQREIYNEGLALMTMDPLERLLTSRQPCGFDFNLANLPTWARQHLSEEQRELFASPGYPLTYLLSRAHTLADALMQETKDGDPSRDHVDAIVSLAERLYLVSMPRRTTVGWLKVMLHYGHTISGELTAGGDNNPLLAALAERTHLTLGLSEVPDRDAPNGRWLVGYTKGIMDTDALSDVVFGELYVPVTIEATDGPIPVGYIWNFPVSMAEAVAEYTCRFAKPFWAPYEVDGDVRWLPLPEDKGMLVETLHEAPTATSYRYTARGLTGVAGYVGEFRVDSSEVSATLSWNVEFTCDAPEDGAGVIGHIASAAQQMASAMDAHFRPQSPLAADEVSP